MTTRRIEQTSLLAGALFIVTALLLLLWLIPHGVDAPRKVKFAALHPAYYPRIVACVLLLIGIATTLTAFKKGADIQHSEAQITTTVRRTIVLLVLAILATVAFFMLPILGFPLTTGSLLLVAMPLAGERRWLIVLLVAVLLPTLLYLFFTKVANIPIPGGVLESWLQKL